MFQVPAGGVAVGGAFVAVPLGKKLVAGAVFPRVSWVRAALAVVDGVVAVVLFGHPQGLAFGAGLDVNEAVKPVVRVFGVPFPVVYPKQVVAGGMRLTLRSSLGVANK
ncbi:MAG: hypothetical protein AB1766_08530 [Pseudomonadota bacterium]